jgi:general secretion pathway protein A
MYNNYFGFSESPFNITPSSRFYFRTPSCEEVFAIVHHGIETRKGVIAVTGLPGTGKTLLLKFLVRHLDPKIKTVIVNNPHTDLNGLLRLLLNRLDLDAAADASTAMFDRLTDCLVEQRRNGLSVCLLIDEAQDLDENTLDELRLLSNLDFEDEALLSIVLLGQPELDIKLDRPSVRRIKQRVALTRHIYPLNRKETGPYIDSRLKVAKYEGTGLFDPEAIEKISDYSRGIPRLINSICDNSLIRAYTANHTVISPEIIDQVARELRIAAPRSPQKQSVPTELSDFRTVAAPFADDAGSIAKDIVPLDVENPESAAVQPQSSASAVEHQLGTTEDLHGYSGGDRSTASDGKGPPTSDLYSRAGTDELTHFYVLPRERSGISLLRSRWIPVAAAIGLLLLVIGKIVSSSQLAVTYSTSSTANQKPVAGGPIPQPLQERTGNSVESDGAAVAPHAATPITSEPEQLEIATDHPMAKRKADRSTALAETNGEKTEPTNALQSELQRNSNAPPEQPAKIPANNRHENKPPAVTAEVVGTSIVRDKPSDKAKIIGDLEAGSRVTVLAESRDYFHVRSLDNKSIRGYVHREDAFFKRKK